MSDRKTHHIFHLMIIMSVSYQHTVAATAEVEPYSMFKSKAGSMSRDLREILMHRRNRIRRTAEHDQTMGPTVLTTNPYRRSTTRPTTTFIPKFQTSTNQITTQPVTTSSRKPDITSTTQMRNVTTEKLEDDGESKLLVIVIPAVAGGAALIIIFIVGIICCRCHKTNKTDVATQVYNDGAPPDYNEIEPYAVNESHGASLKRVPNGLIEPEQDVETAKSTAKNRGWRNSALPRFQGSIFSYFRGSWKLNEKQRKKSVVSTMQNTDPTPSPYLSEHRAMDKGRDAAGTGTGQTRREKDEGEVFHREELQKFSPRPVHKTHIENEHSPVKKKKRRKNSEALPAYQTSIKPYDDQVPYESGDESGGIERRATSIKRSISSPSLVSSSSFSYGPSNSQVLDARRSLRSFPKYEND